MHKKKAFPKNTHARWAHFIEVCHTLKETETLQSLLELLLTPEEKEALADRLLIIEKLLSQKETQREIAAKLGVGIATVTRGSNCIKQINPSLQNFLMKNSSLDE